MVTAVSHATAEGLREDLLTCPAVGCVVAATTGFGSRFCTCVIDWAMSAAAEGAKGVVGGIGRSALSPTHVLGSVGMYGVPSHCCGVYVGLLAPLGLNTGFTVVG